MLVSLVPRLSHHLVFDHLQHGPFYCVNDVNVYLCGQRGVGSPTVVSVQVLELQMRVKRKTYSLLFRRKSTCECVVSVRDPSPSVDIDIIHMIKWTTLGN